MSKITSVTISRFLILVSLFIVPVLFLPFNIISIAPFKMFLILFVSIVVAVMLLIKKIKANSFFITKNSLILAIAAVLATGLLSSLFSDNIITSFVGRQTNVSSFLGLLLLFSLACSIAQLFTDAQSKTKLFLTLYIATILSVFIHLLNILIPIMPDFGFFFSNTSNIIGKWYELGLFGVFGLMSSILVYQYVGHSKLYKILGIFGMVTSAILVILINSLLVWILAGVFSLFYVVLNVMVKRDSEIQHRLSHPALGVLILSIVFILLGNKATVLLNTTFNFQFEEVKPTLSSTYKVSKDTLYQKPALGYGINRFEQGWLLNRPDGVNLSNYWDTDFKYGYSNILSVFVTQGILGSLAWIFFIIASIVLMFRLFLATIINKTDTFINLYSILGYAFFLAVMLVYVPTFTLVLMFFVFLGLLMANANSAGLFRYKEIFLDKNPRSTLAYLFVLVVALIFFIYTGYVAVTQYASRIIVDRANQEYSQTGNALVFENKLQLAQFIFNSDTTLRALSELSLANLNRILQNSNQNTNQEQVANQFRAVLQQTVQYAQLAIAYDEYSYSNRIAFSRIYTNLVQLEVPGAAEEAFAVLEEANRLSPNNPTIILEKARTYSFANNFQAAKNEINQALELKPNFVGAVFLLSQIQVEEGNIDEAILSIQNALSIQPQNSNLYFQLGLLRYNQQKYADAVVSFENAVIRSPYFGNAKYFLGLSYYNDRRTEDAIAQFQDLVALYPQDAEVVKILENLTSGRSPLDGIASSVSQAPENRDKLPLEENDPEVTEEEEE